jgi:hypothetical protein
MAWTGGDEVVIALRQGLHSRILQKFQKNDDDTVIAGAVAHWEDEEKADAVFIDIGYGTGVYSYGKQANRNWMLVSFGSKSSTAGFFNKRAEMWGKMKQWLIEGGSIDDDQRVVDDLTAPEATNKLSGAIILESKESMRRRGIPSPSNADAIALTFAFSVEKKSQNKKLEFAKRDYDPLA